MVLTLWWIAGWLLDFVGSLLNNNTVERVSADLHRPIRFSRSGLDEAFNEQVCVDCPQIEE